MLDVVIVGAGPAGLAAAIAAKARGMQYAVIEKGALVNSLLHYPTDMVFFTTPELLEIGGLPFMSPHDKPTRAEALNYYRKVVDAYDLQICYGEKVTAVDQSWMTGTTLADSLRSQCLTPNRRRHRPLGISTPKALSTTPAAP